MKKLWLIAVNEFRINVFKKSFILTLLSVPLMLGLNVGVGLTMEALEDNDAPVGYIDPTGLLSDPTPPPVGSTEDLLELIPFQTAEEAQAALQAEEIQAYYVLPVDYPESIQVELVYLEEPGENATRQFYDFLQINLLNEQRPEVALRASEGSEVTIRSPDGMLEFPAGGPRIGQVIPLVLGLAFIFLLMMSSGYLMSGVVEEKQNLTMEVLMTSVSESQMIAGKVIGIVAIGIIQFFTWVLFGVLAVFIGGNVLGLQWFQNPTMEWGTLLMMSAIAVPSYITASALMFTLGSTVAEAQEGQSVGGIFFLVHMLPLYALVSLIETPNGPLAIGMSLAPFTSLLTIGLRNLFMQVPLWQVLVSVLIQCLCAVGTLWLASKAFRLGMLRYGKRLRLNEILGKQPASVAKASTS